MLSYSTLFKIVVHYNIIVMYYQDHNTQPDIESQAHTYHPHLDTTMREYSHSHMYYVHACVCACVYAYIIIMSVCMHMP